ncbi:PAP fibrillin family protein [Chondrocystis sp. NIES-4102]|nr:PAP fibrillin family protein [Chondrocystis sp. NIES-4102]
MSKKAQLLEAIAGKNRGLLANEIDNVRVLAAIQKLEDINPTPQPLEAKELLNGNWRLLYTTSKGILGLDRVPLFKLGQIYQCIRVESAKVYNIAEIMGLPMLEGLVSVCATFEPVSERRVNVVFERSIIGLQRILGYNSPGKFIDQIESGKKFLPVDFKIDRGEQQGWLDVTYLDQDMRIGRGNEGNVFVLTKENYLS